MRPDRSALSLPGTTGGETAPLQRVDCACGRIWSSSTTAVQLSPEFKPYNPRVEACMVRWIILLLSTATGWFGFIGGANHSPAPDTPEAGSVEAIAAATGDKHFLSPWVSYLPLVGNSPIAHALPGKDRRLRRRVCGLRPKAYAYCRALAAAFSAGTGFHPWPQRRRTRNPVACDCR